MPLTMSGAASMRRAFMIKYPRPSLAAISSAATMVIHADPKARRNPVNRNGIAAGRTTVNSTWRRLAPRLAAARPRIAGTSRIPETVLSSIGQKAPRKIRKTMACRPIPNHRIASGVHAIDLSNPATYVTWSTTPFGGYKPVFFDEGGTGGASFPDIYLVASSYDGVYNTNNVIMVKLIRSGGSYTQTNLTTVNFLTGFANIAALNNYLSTGNELYHFSYNPVKRRIYIVEGGIGMMLVYKFNGGLGGGLSIADWWVGTPDKTKLDFEKIIAIPGAAGRWYDTSTDLYAVEYDLANGQEKSITISRTGATDQTGNITRIPWVE